MDIAFESQLIRRRRSIDPADLLFALCMESSQGTVSHNDLAAQLESGTGVSVSKVSIWKKINEQCLLFLKKVLELVIHSKFIKNRSKPETLFFDRIVVRTVQLSGCPRDCSAIFQVWPMAIQKSVTHVFRGFMI